MSVPGSASGGPPGPRRATSVGRAECETVRSGPPGPHSSHGRLSTARIPIATHRRRARMLAPTTALAERAGRCHSSEWGYPGPAPRWPRARPTCQAPAVAMLAPGRSPARPPCGRPRCTPHRRASNNTMATKPSRQVKIAARGSPRRAELLPFPERGQETGDRDKDDDNEPGKPGNERHLVGWTGCGRRGSVNGD